MTEELKSINEVSLLKMYNVQRSLIKNLQQFKSKALSAKFIARQRNFAGT